MITSICIICIFLTKQVSRLKLVILQTTTSGSAKLYTMAKIGANSCPMAEKRIHKFHGIFRNAHSYLKGRIIRIGKYLHTLMFRGRRWRPLVTPPGMGYIRRTGIMECQSGSNHSHSMVSVMLLPLNLLFCCYMHLFRLRFLSSPIGGASISYFKNFCPRPRTRPRIRPRTRVIWFFRTITLESFNQSEPNFHT